MLLGKGRVTQLDEAIEPKALEPPLRFHLPVGLVLEAVDQRSRAAGLLLELGVSRQDGRAEPTAIFDDALRSACLEQFENDQQRQAGKCVAVIYAGQNGGELRPLV